MRNTNESSKASSYKPVYRSKPKWIDGLYSTLTYIVVAVKKRGPVPAKVAVRKLEEDLYKVKFYPTVDEWGFTEEQLEELGGSHFLNRPGKYGRCTMDAHDLHALLKKLSVQGAATLKFSKMLEAEEVFEGRDDESGLVVKDEPSRVAVFLDIATK